MLNKNISWINASLYMFALSFIMFNIISYSYDKAFGLVSVFVIFNFSMFFFLRRNYEFFVKTVVAFFIIGILGSFLMFILNPIYLAFFMLIVFYVSFSTTIVEHEQKIEKAELRKLLLFDASLFLFFLMIFYYSYKYLINL